MASERKISGKTIIIIIIFFAAILFVKSGLFSRNNSTEKHNTTETEKGNNPSSRSEKNVVGSSFFSSLRSWEDYQVIVDDNLFRPLGWEKSAVKKVVRKTKPKTETVETPRESPEPTYSLTLTGIAQNGSEWLAIVEDETRKEGYFLHSGEKLKDSLVSEIFPEHIILAQGDIKGKLPLGTNIQYNTNGQLLLDTVKDYQYSVEEVQEEDKLQSLIERMKARRRKELSQE